MAHLYGATVVWTRGEQPFVDRLYSRAHRWLFDGGADVPASSSPLVVPLPLSDASGVDPEEAFVASLASCHMLFFLDFASRAGLLVDRYEDKAEGRMGKNAQGRTWIEQVVLRPAVTLSRLGGGDPAGIDDLHHRSHDYCFIAHSVRSEVLVEPAPLLFA
ncbi:MAG: OsmC family protein [Alsobacter sp.]